MKKLFFTFAAILIASFGKAQTESYTDSITNPTHMNVLVHGWIWNSSSTNTASYAVEHSLDGINFTVATDTTDGLVQGQTFVTKVVMANPNTLNYYRLRSWNDSVTGDVLYNTVSILTPDTPQTNLIIDFPQTDSTANSVTGNFMWTGGDTTSTAFTHYGYTPAANVGVISFSITGSGDTPVTISGLFADTTVYTRSYISTPGFNLSSNHYETMYTGTIVGSGIMVTVDTSFGGLLEGLATVNVTVGGCGPLTVDPVLYENGTPAQLQSGTFTLDTVWTFPVTMNQFGASYSLEITATGTCAPMTEVANFASPSGSPFMIISHGALATSPSDLTVGGSFDPGDLSSGSFSISIVNQLTSIPHQVFGGVEYVGPNSRSENSSNLSPGVPYVVTYVYSDSTGTVPDVTAIDTVVMPNVLVPVMMFQGPANTGDGSFSQVVDVNVMGVWTASTSTMYSSLRLTNPSQNQGQTSVPSITLSNPLHTISRNNLLAGGTYELKVWGVNQGGTSDTIYRDVVIPDATNPNVFLQSFTEMSGNQVKSVVYVEANGNPIDLEYTVFRNGDQNFDHTFSIPLGSSADTTITIVHNPVYANCDQLQIQVAGFIPSGLFNPAIPSNNLETIVTINEASCANSIEESFWEDTRITSGGIIFAQKVEGTVQVVDMMGRTIDSQSVNGREVTFSKVSTSSIYTVVVNTKDGVQYSKKLMLGL